MKSKIYPRIYEEDDMESIGILFEYCEEFFKEEYSAELKILEFLTDFMNSQIRKEMEEGNYRELLALPAQELFLRYINVDLGGNYSRYIGSRSEKDDFCFDQRKWIGWTYVMYHTTFKLPSKEIIKVMPIVDMCEYYITGHQIGPYNFLSKTVWKFEDAGLLPKGYRLRRQSYPYI